MPLFDNSKVVMARKYGSKPVLQHRPVNVKWIPQLSLKMRTSLDYREVQNQNGSVFDIERYTAQKHTDMLVAEAKRKRPEITHDWTQLVRHHAEDDLTQRSKIITSTLSYGGACLLDQTTGAETPVYISKPAIEKLSELWDCLSGEYEEPEIEDEVPF